MFSTQYCTCWLFGVNTLQWHSLEVKLEMNVSEAKPTNCAQLLHLYHCAQYTCMCVYDNYITNCLFALHKYGTCVAGLFGQSCFIKRFRPLLSNRSRVWKGWAITETVKVIHVVPCKFKWLTILIAGVGARAFHSVEVLRQHGQVRVWRTFVILWVWRLLHHLLYLLYHLGNST